MAICLAANTGIIYRETKDVMRAQKGAYFLRGKDGQRRAMDAHTVSPVTWGLLDWLTGGRKIYPKSGPHLLVATDLKDHKAALCSWLACLHSAAATETSLTGDRIYFLGTLTRPESS